MNCFECDKTIEIKKYRAFQYEGVGLGNVFLLNTEVEVCSGCGIETAVLRNPAKIHNAIGVAIALQESRLSGDDVRYLRRSAGYSVGDWAKRLNVVVGTYSKWENSHRRITPQADKLARINYINALKQKDPENVRVARYLDVVLNLNAESSEDFIIAVNAEKPETDAKYLPETSPLLVKPEISVVEARTLPVEPLANVIIMSGHLPAISAFESELNPNGEISNVRDAFALAA